MNRSELLVASLATLERRCVWQQRILTLMAVLLASFGLIAAGPAARPEERPDRKVLLVDKQGRERLVAELDASGNPTLAFLAADGKPRLKASIDRDGTARVRFLNEKQAVRLELYNNTAEHKLSPGSAGIDIASPQGFAGIHFVARADGAVRQHFADLTGLTRAETLIEPNRLVSHTLFGEKYARVRSLVYPVDDKEHPGWAGSENWTPDGKPRSYFFSKADGMTAVGIDRAAGEWTLRAAGLDTPVIEALRLLAQK